MSFSFCQLLPIVATTFGPPHHSFSFRTLRSEPQRTADIPPLFNSLNGCYRSLLQKLSFPASPYTASKPREKEIHHREPCARQAHIDRLPSSKLHSPDSCFFHPGLSGLLPSLSSTSRRTRIHSPLPSSSSPPASHIHITSVYARYTHLSNILPRTFTPSA